MTDDHPNIRLHLVDDDEVLLQAITQIYELEDIDVIPTASPQELLERITDDFPGVIVTDVRMPKIDGFALFEKVKKIDPEIPVTFITGHADVPMVLKTMRDGAFDFLAKPIDSEHLIASARRAMQTRRLVLENRQLQSLIDRADSGSGLIGESQAIEGLRQTIRQVASTDVDILIEGETGTGKELVAKLIHKWSNRSNRKLEEVNCAALPENIAEIELFGQASEAGTATRSDKIGRIESSDKGTIFLDEIESLPHSTQSQLLPVLEDRRVTRVGGVKSEALDLRIIATAKVDLFSAVANQEFRDDLFYRLNTIRLRIPPLRERKDDIPLLFAHFLAQAADRFGKKVPKVGLNARHRLTEHDWPGNVRELKNFAEAVVLGIESLESPSRGEELSLPERVERFEASTICSALEMTRGEVRQALEVLKIPRKTFYDKINRHKIDMNSYRKKQK